MAHLAPRIDADDFGDSLDTVPLEQSKQSLVDALDRTGTFINPTRIDLHRRGAGLDLVIGVGRVENATYANDRQLGPGELVNVFDE